MTKILKDFRVRIHDLGTATPIDGTVDFTLTALARYPEYGQQVIHPGKGRTESSPWRIEVVDVDEILTDELAATTGRMHLLGRLVEIQDSTDGGGWATVATGRFSNLSLATNPANYLIEISDERWMERSAILFDVSDTTQIWPPGLRYGWRQGFPIAQLATGTLIKSTGSARTIRLYSQWPISQELISWIRQDVVGDPDPARTDGSGNFTHLRCEIDGTDREVLGFGNYKGTGVDITAALDLMGPSPGGIHLDIVVWAASINASFDACLWAPTAKPCKALPLHLGTNTGAHDWGEPDPWDMVQAIYDELGVRYDSAAFTALQTSSFYALNSPRLEKPISDVARFLDDRYYGPSDVVPFIDSQGRIAPKSIRLPEDVDPTTLFQFNESNLREPPTWNHQGKDIVNILEAHYDFHRSVTLEGGAIAGSRGAPGQPTRSDWPSDLLVVDELTIREEYDNLANVGEHSAEVDLSGFIPVGEGTSQLWDAGSYETVQNLAKWIAREKFERWGDGAQRGDMKSLRQVADGSGRTPEDDVEAGDLVTINVDTYPNAIDNDRGGTRVVQIMSKKPVGLGIDWEFFDVGPSLQPPAEPTVSIAQNAGQPKHAVDVTISNLPSGATAQLEVGVGGASDWSRKLEGLANGVHTIGRLPSGTTIYARARTCIPNRSRSDWSIVDSVATASLSAPSSLSVGSIVGDRATASWTNGEANYPTELLLDGTRVAVLVPGTTEYRLKELTISTTYNGPGVTVRHIDDFGGVSTGVDQSFVTTGTATVLTEPYAVTILVGGLPV